MGGMAVYEIAHGEAFAEIRYFIVPADEKDMTALEIGASEVICSGYEEMDDVVAGRVDPFKAAEKILADYYGSAKMVKSDYEWRPRIRY